MDRRVDRIARRTGGLKPFDPVGESVEEAPHLKPREMHAEASVRPVAKADVTADTDIAPETRPSVQKALHHKSVSRPCR